MDDLVKLGAESISTIIICHATITNLVKYTYFAFRELSSTPWSLQELPVGLGCGKVPVATKDMYMG